MNLSELLAFCLCRMHIFCSLESLIIGVHKAIIEAYIVLNFVPQVKKYLHIALC